MKTSFSENLKYALDCKGLYTKELAELTGIKTDTLSSYLKSNGSEPTASKAVKIAEALGVSVEFLVTGRDKSVPQNIRENVLELLKDLNRLSDEDLSHLKYFLRRL